ncbi:lysosomal acid phosphatase-like [Trichogramma pretiosum]|uniref:lysosomal acid phosphatase-like n=1 Tax=Trichogramma pretiosum TaxID=7493 RepID=UPI0006C96C8E|nr:lysosomal acid phosphatase-like [Trichogramma pretiosum]XP_023316781.1 lysosomal acid phosphatase-like [Trichogramma pretiosum]
MMESRSMWSQGCHPSKRKTCIGVVLLAVVIGSVLLAYTTLAAKPARDPALRKVFVVFRHGDRTPTETYPNDPHINYPWPGGWGALTKLGMRQLYKLGGWLREEFGWIVDHKYSPASTMVQSSYADRCIMSTQALLAGLFPVDDEEAFVPGLHWQPIPVHYTPRALDKLINVKYPCPRLEAALQEAYRNESLKSGAELESYYEQLSNITGQTIKTVTDVEFLYNTLEIEDFYGLEIPPALKKLYEEPLMRKLAAVSYTMFTSNTVAQRLRGGPMLKHILDIANSADDGKSGRMFLYGSHDINIVNMLRAMGFTDELFKLELGVSLIFELRAVDGGQSQEFRISMLNNTDAKVPHRLRIRGCEDRCLVEDLYRVWNDTLPEDWDKECQL